MVVGIYKQTAQDIMTTHAVTLRPQDSIHHALTVMAENDVSAVPVLEPDGRCVGMLTQRDIISETQDMDAEDCTRAEYKAVEWWQLDGVALEELTSQRVEDIMSTRLVSVATDSTVTEIADSMLQQRIHHMPVLDDNGRLLGIISTMDILAGLRHPVA